MARIPRFELGVMLCAALTGPAFAQAPAPPTLSPSDGTTPSTNTPGSPAEAYRLSDIDNINAVTGRISFAIPVVDIPGRGAARITLVAHQETYCNVEAQPYPYDCGPGGCSYGTSFVVLGTPWNVDDPDYVSGVMQMRASGNQCLPATESTPQYWQYALTRLTYIAPDGSETEFRDNITGGLREPGSPTAGDTFNRGNAFSAYDASSSVFTVSGSAFDPSGDISDPVGCPSPATGLPSPGNGTLQLRDGTSYTFTDSYLTQIEDRNGNYLSINRSAPPTVTVLDSYGRTTTITEGTNQDTIVYPGDGGTERTVTVARNNLGNLLYTPPGQPTTTTLPTQCAPGQTNCLFGFVPCGSGTEYQACSTAVFSPPGYISEITLPNAQAYQFLYNPYGDVASVTLPTGGSYVYTYQTSVATAGSGGSQAWTIQRQLMSKSIYLTSGATTPAQVITYSYGGGYTTVTYKDGAGNVLGSEQHTAALVYTPIFDGTQYMQWMNDKETNVAFYGSAAGGGGTLKNVAYAYQQRSCSTGPPCWFTQPPYNYTVDSPLAPLHDPQTVSQTTTINGQVSAQNYFYDQYNNESERDEYDFGTGSPGSPIRATVTAYQYYAGAPPAASILNLPQQRLVCTAIGTGCTTSTATARTNYTYDGAAYPPVVESSIGNHDPAYSTGGANNLTRGNATTVTQYLSPTASLASNYSYDIAGNILTAWDPRLVVHSYGYADSGPLTSGLTFALPTSVTSYT
jgi:hypothetical protein